MWGLLACIIAAYGALLVQTFGSSDGYALCMMGVRGADIAAITRRDGRPLLGPSFDLVAGDRSTFTVMWRFRIIFLLRMLVVVVVFFRLLCAL